MNLTEKIVTWICALTGFLRLIGVKDLLYKDCAHVIVGITLGAFLLTGANRLYWFGIFCILILIECFCAFYLHPANLSGLF